MSKPLTFQDKINRLESMHKGSASVAREQISQWRDKMAELGAQKEWMSHPMTQKLAGIARDQIRHLTALLGNTEDIPDLDRKSLFAEKRAHFAYLSALSENPESEMATIERAVDAELAPE